MIFYEKDPVSFRERGQKETVDGVVIGKVQALPVLYIVQIDLQNGRFRYVVADEKELKIRRK